MAHLFGLEMQEELLGKLWLNVPGAATLEALPGNIVAEYASASDPGGVARQYCGRICQG